MRTRYISDESGHWIPAEEWYERQQSAPIVMPDIAPYQSMITGEIINSRSRHREHLREHGCIEIGNETKQLMQHYENTTDVAPRQRHELIRAQVNEMSHEQLRKAVKKDADFIKWNSRER